MTILAIGGTGQIGSLVVNHLSKQGAEVRVLTQHAVHGRNCHPAWDWTQRARGWR